MPDTAVERRLWDTFAAECAAYMKYTFFAQAARQEGFERIADIFEETASNEKAHARLWFQALGAFPDGKQSGDTLKNLQAAAQGEHMEWEKQYRECAADARQAGDEVLAARFEGVAAIEADHETRFRDLIARMRNGETFSRPSAPGTLWRCRFCGHTQPGAAAPDTCPVCDYPQAYFEVNPNRE